MSPFLKVLKERGILKEPGSPWPRILNGRRLTLPRTVFVAYCLSTCCLDTGFPHAPPPRVCACRRAQETSVTTKEKETQAYSPLGEPQVSVFAFLFNDSSEDRGETRWVLRVCVRAASLGQARMCRVSWGRETSVESSVQMNAQKGGIKLVKPKTTSKYADDNLGLALR